MTELRRPSSARPTRQIIAILFSLATLPAAATGLRADPILIGSSRFAHGPGWERVVGRTDGRFLGSSLRSFRPGARATLDFSGTKLRLYGVLGATGGIAIVRIDGKFADVMSFFAPVKATHRQVYATPRLRRGAHHLTIEVVRPSRDPTARPGFVNIDGADVTP